MLEWIANNLGTVIVAVIVLCIVATVVGVMYRDKKQGRSACGGSCIGCSMNCPNASKNNKD